VMQPGGELNRNGTVGLWGLNASGWGESIE
jgi:hypothetical protein